MDESKPAEINQAPNRVGVWSRSQKPRSKAMTGPRFEQTDFDLQVRNDGKKGNGQALTHQIAAIEERDGDDSQGAGEVDAREDRGL
jgi:hypothetical protein